MSLPEYFIDSSTLSKAQVESLVSFVRVKQREMTVREAAAKRSRGGVTAGSYLRTVGQGREKIKGSVRTLIITLWLGLVNPEDVSKLLGLASRGLQDLDEEEIVQAVELVEALIERIVT